MRSYAKAQSMPVSAGLILAAALTVIASDAIAASPSMDLADALARARRAWQKADALGAQAGAAMRSDGGGSDRFLKLLDEQEAEYNAAEEGFRAVLKADSEHLHALAEYGFFLAARKRFGEASVRLESALLSSRAKTAFEPAERADVLRMLGATLERAGRVARAVELYRHALTLNEADARNRISLAVGLCALGEPSEALPLLRPYAQPAGLAAGTPPALQALGLYTLAYAEEQDGMPEEALAMYRRARGAAIQAGAASDMGVSEQARLASRRLSATLKDINGEKGARERYARAVALCDEGRRLKAQALQDRAAFERAMSAYLGAAPGQTQALAKEEGPMKPFHEALSSFQEAVQTYVELPRAHRELGLCRLALGELEPARRHLEAAALYDPLALNVWAALGEVCLMLEDGDAAMEAFTRLTHIEPEYGPAYLGVGSAAVKLHRSPRDCHAALDALDRAERLGVDISALAPVRAQAKDFLARLERGERLPAAPRRAESGAPPVGRPPELFQPWKGTILEP